MQYNIPTMQTRKEKPPQLKPYYGGITLKGVFIKSIDHFQFPIHHYHF